MVIALILILLWLIASWVYMQHTFPNGSSYRPRTLVGSIVTGILFPALGTTGFVMLLFIIAGYLIKTYITNLFKRDKHENSNQH
jgi:hypothetical protein